MTAPVTAMKQKLLPYLPGILLFIVAAIVALCVYQDYGISWDETYQRGLGQTTYDYIFHGSNKLITDPDRYHGPGFDLLLTTIEQKMVIKDVRDIYLMRHLVTHMYFLVSCFFAYILAFRLFGSKFIACLGMVMLLTAPRIYAHSFFNSKDVPTLATAVIALTICQMAFEQRSKWLFLVTGMLCGFAASIRLPAVILFAVVLLFLVIELAIAMKKKERLMRAVWMLFLFTAGFCMSLYGSWPYLWQDPVSRFLTGYRSLAHYNWDANVFFNGQKVNAMKLPWTYFPVWFSISVPVCWLACGIGGIVWVITAAIKAPVRLLQNSTERYFVLLLCCFAGPVLAVILMHSVIYDDWRHLYFVYPPFVFMALYFVNRLMLTKARLAAGGLCLVQAVFVIWFMAGNHPFQQVYFNELVSHDKEYLRKHYELDYWGASFKQALEQIARTDQRPSIKIANGFLPLTNNIMMLEERDRKRMQVNDDMPDYMITNYRGIAFNQYDDLKAVYSVSVLNSTILCIYTRK
ncbi:MAG: hypothetical protein JWQ38_1757 [Flavipsychrobacter sp.]|nr:hypothetical protein [Flavipsychrobacter sp.]